MNLEALLKKEVTQQELLNYYNACITYKILPVGIDGCVFQYKGINNIFINCDLSNYKRKKTILHELAHIELSQFNQISRDLFEFNVKGYEDDANIYIKQLLNKIVDNNL